jgi:enoyl-CoA hydratase/carnithine racemase
MPRKTPTPPQNRLLHEIVDFATNKSDDRSVDYSHIEYESRDGVGHVRLNRPDKLNTLGIGPGSSRDEIARALGGADQDPSVRCLLITAAGRAFCAGGDLTGAPPTETPLDEHLLIEEIDQFHDGLRSLHKPVVTAVQGLCLGTALGFIAQSDLVIASDDARFGLIEGRIGHPGAIDIVPLVGAQWAKFMILTGELLDAAYAEKIGLVLTTVPADELQDRAFDLARRIARVPAEAALLNKAAINRMTDAAGRSAGRLVGRAHDVVTKSMSSHAKAPDGRRFDEIMESEGMDGLKRARESQFSGGWLHRPGSGGQAKKSKD